MNAIESRARYICAQRNFLEDCDACNEREGEVKICEDLWEVHEEEAILLFLRETLQDNPEALKHVERLAEIKID